MNMTFIIQRKTPSLSGGSYLGDSLIHELEHFFESPFSGRFFQKLNTETGDLRLTVKEVEDAYHIQASLPGFKKEEVYLKIENGTLDISAKKEKSKDSCEMFDYQDLSRRVYLGDVDLKNSTAELKNGILSLTLKKPKSKQAQHLEIK